MKTFLLAVFSLFALASCGGGGGGGGGGSLSVETPVLQVCKANERLVGDRCAPILADAPTKSCDGAKPILTDGGECRERRASDCVGDTPDFVNGRCEAACPSGQTRNSGVCESLPTTKQCADGLKVALDAVCMKDCNGGRIPESEICPPPTKRCADGLEVALDAVCMKDCNGGRIPESEICPPPTKRCADGLEVALNAVCMKDCNGGRIPESEICPPPTKRCADGLEVALNAVCMKDCNGGRIPESEICPPPTKRCADGVEVAVDTVCRKHCNGGLIPESEICPPPPTTKRCADGLEIALSAVCMKDCNGGRIPESEICPPPTKRCADGMEIAIDAVCMKDCNGGRMPEADVCPRPSPMHRSHSHCTADCAAGWSLNAMQAGHAYARGYFGQGVTVGIYESGILATHEDLISNVVITSTAYTSNPMYNGIVLTPPGNYHANPVFGIVVAKRNGKGTHGVAPQAKAIPVT